MANGKPLGAEPATLGLWSIESEAEFVHDARAKYMRVREYQLAAEVEVGGAAADPLANAETAGRRRNPVSEREPPEEVVVLTEAMVYARVPAVVVVSRWHLKEIVARLCAGRAVVGRVWKPMMAWLWIQLEAGIRLPGNGVAITCRSVPSRAMPDRRWVRPSCRGIAGAGDHRGDVEILALPQPW